MKTTVFPVAMKHQEHCPPEWQIPPAAAVIPIAQPDTRRTRRSKRVRRSLRHLTA